MHKHAAKHHTQHPAIINNTTFAQAISYIRCPSCSIARTACKLTRLLLHHNQATMEHNPAHQEENKEEGNSKCNTKKTHKKPENRQLL